MAENKEELKSLLMRVKRGEWKSWHKTQHSKMKIMASAPITSWQMDGGKMETVLDFIFLGSKITVEGDCSDEMERCLLLGRKTMTNLDSILKSKDIPLLTKICIVKTMVFPLVMWELDHKRRLSTEELILWNCAGEDSWESLGQQRDQTSQSQRKSTLSLH